MDTEYDFITPEFLHLMFFQQKNLVIFPYVDLKHLRSLDIFAVGFETIDIDSTVIHNLSEIIEYESNNSYSQRPSLYFILNPREEELSTLLTCFGVRCVVNARGNVEKLANGDKFVFYNKKNNSFLNYSFDNRDLTFERHLIESSSSKQVLLDEILRIKSVSSRIFSEINETNSTDNLPGILSDYDQKYWKSILDFTRTYYQITIPKFDALKSVPRRKTSPEIDFSVEYEAILKSNRTIGKSFVSLLHDYRFKRVNPANMEVDQLFYPQKLYNYLRNRHWKRGVPKDFVLDWAKAVNQDENIKEDTLCEFQIVLNKLNCPYSLFELGSLPKPLTPVKPLEEFHSLQTVSENKSGEELDTKSLDPIPSVNHYSEFKEWILKKLSELESLSE